MSDTNAHNDAYNELLRQHSKLRGLLDEIKLLLFERQCPFSEVASRLQDLREQVDVHFRTEEDSGCFGDLVNHAPRVSEKVVSLIAEHNDLSTEIHEIVERASSGIGQVSDWDEVSTMFGEFTAKLVNHETVENELMQEVFTEDIGSKD